MHANIQLYIRINCHELRPKKQENVSDNNK